MNRNQAKEFYPFLQAFAEGSVIECRTKPSVIKGVNGEFYPCKPDIFDKTYERA